MKEKDINLFNTAIHKVKNVMVIIERERQRYHNKLEKLMKTITTLRNTHDKKMKQMMTEASEILDEMYELFDDLTN